MIRLIVILVFLMASVSRSEVNPLTMPIKNSQNIDEIKIKDTEILNSYKREQLKNPEQTMRTFIEAMDKIKRGLTSSFDEAVLTMDLSKIEPSLKLITGKITSERLINTIDRIAKINFDLIPTYEEGPKWYFRKQSVAIGDRVFDVEISLGKTVNGVWRFTPETVSSIDHFYSSVASLKVVDGVTDYQSWRSQLKNKMPAWTSEEFLTLKKGQWLGMIMLFLSALIFLVLVRYLLTLYLSHKVNQKVLAFISVDPFKSTLPFGLLAFSLIWHLGIRFLEFGIHPLEFFMRTSSVMMSLFMVWSALKIVDYVSLRFEKISTDKENKFDDVLIPMLKTTSKVMVVSFGALIVAHSLAFDVASILAGLGIGGVAVALAAKDTISNLFGSVTVLIDRPFQIGDYVSLEKTIEGTVEQVGFRSTRLRTPYNSLVTIPNSVLANMAIDNYGMRKVRRYKTFVQFDYSTSIEKIEEFCQKVRDIIKVNPLIQKENAIVSLYEIKINSIDIMVTIFFATDNLKVELSERHQFISEMLKIANELKVNFCSPPQTIVIEKKTS